MKVLEVSDACCFLLKVQSSLLSSSSLASFVPAVCTVNFIKY